MQYIEKKHLLDKAVAIYNSKKRKPTCLYRISKNLPKLLKEEYPNESIYINSHGNQYAYFYEERIFFFIKGGKLNYVFDNEISGELEEIYMAIRHGRISRDTLYNFDDKKEEN